MDHLRRARCWLPAWLAGLLLFAQLATAAYACPQLGAGAATRAAAMADMPDCEAGKTGASMDPDQPQLCKAHCESGQQSTNGSASLGTVPAPALVDALWAREVIALDADPGPPQRLALYPPGPPPGTPPLYLSLLVLRN